MKKAESPSLRDAEQSLAADGATACFSSNLSSIRSDADRAPQLKSGVMRLSLGSEGTKMFCEKGASLASMIVFASVVFAQGSSFRPAYPKRHFKHDGKIVSEYRVEYGVGKTFVELEPIFLERSEKENTSLRLSAIYEHEGKSPVKPTHISLAFFTLYPECKIPDRPEMSMIVDGHLVKFGFTFKSFRERKPDEEGVAFSFSEMEGARCNELVAIFISQASFLKIVNGQNVEFHIGQFKFKLNESSLEAMRDLASRMAT